MSRTPSISACAWRRTPAARQLVFDLVAKGGAARGEQQGVVGQLGERDVGALREGMPSGSDADQVLGEQRISGDFGIVDGQVHDRELEQSRHELREQRGGTRLHDRRSHPRVVDAERLEQAGHEPARGRADDAQPDVA
jgi:hypothetical protein